MNAQPMPGSIEKKYIMGAQDMVTLDIDTVLDAEALGYIEHMVALQGNGEVPFKGRIHPDDEMFHNTVGKVMSQDDAYIQYFWSGTRTMKAIKSICYDLFNGIDKCASVLEFASGHGRLTRHLVREVPPSRIWASDIYKSATVFQKEYFGVDTILSVRDPDEFNCQQKFQLIIVGSLFSHLPDLLFRGWLGRLLDCLEDDGVLCMSTVDAATNVGRMRLGEMDKSGILFVPMKGESDSLPPEDYGRTIVTDKYLDRMFSEVGGEDIQYRIFKRAMYENQDICLVTRCSQYNLDLVRCGITPLGGIGGVWRVSPTELAVSGWGLDFNQDAQISSAELRANGRLLAVVQTVPATGIEAQRIMDYFPGANVVPILWRFNIHEQEWAPGITMTAVLRSTSELSAEIFLPFAKKLHTDFHS